MVTAILEPSQIVLAALAGAVYAAPFLARMPGEYFQILEMMVNIIKKYNFNLKLLVAAIRILK